MENRRQVLVICPKTDLPLALDEAVEAANILGGRLLQGDVTASDLVDAVSGGEWDTLWFATHGDEHGIVLSDGHLSTSLLTTIVRTSDADLVVLNTCSSLGVALAMHNELLTDLICTIRPVPDKDAFLTGKQLAYHLSRGMTAMNAYTAAKPGQNRDYIYLPGSRTVNNRRRDDDGKSSISLDEIWREVQRIIVLIDGNDSWGTDGLRRNMIRLEQSLKEFMDEYSSRISKIEGSVSTMKIVTILLAVIAFLMLITMGTMVITR